MKTVAVVVPLYKSKLTATEEISLNQCFRILSDHDIIAVKPHHLDLVNHADFTDVISFENSFFASISGYNKLMLSSEFYGKFLNYQYILIYQPDAYVFKDELIKWCSMGYDYIGAPWLRETPYPDLVKKIKSRIVNYIHVYRNIKQPHSSLPTDKQLENRVGNGGLSLRNTNKFYNICLTHQDEIQKYVQEIHHRFNEDVFWSLEVNRKQRRLRIPDYRKAVYFAMETQLDHAFQITKGQLPFGCHAWDRYPEYWKRFICP
ncbi:DUF5672 family protein [Pedobacter sp. JY14-1]|uniref:DUF5672 family protein n=1 Tax=Pedobacter sp. JY14-1 TaxID=3034151 RepID=UPI0023E12DE3|nr:DUF5672 family protein [Pedobacter sp. JY14-1]